MTEAYDDDMALARATAMENGYHERSPSMMIVVPLDDYSEDGEVLCDDLNASFYDSFFDFSHEGDNDCEATRQQRRLEVASPRSVIEDPFCLLQVGASKTGQPLRRTSNTIPVLTDMMRSSTISTERRSCHRRSRNRALESTYYDRNVLPHLGDELKEYSSKNNGGVSPLLNDCPVAPPFSGRVEVEC